MAPSPRTVKVVLAVAILAFTLGRARKNLALHKPCTASSIHWGDPSAVVNGVVEWGSFALHTETDRPAWIKVDLQGTFRLDEVRVFSRGDELIGEGGDPLPVEVSLDGTTFKEVGRCTPIFSQASPCVVRPGGEPARYVRLTYPFLAICELEVYGAP
jgi:hypothetical protein